MDERSMMLSIYFQRWFQQRYELIIPNCYTQHYNECDMFGIRPSGYCDEIEIKVTRQDFFNDAKKKVFYRSWRRADRFNASESYLWTEAGSKLDEKGLMPVQKMKYQALEDGDLVQNYFYYAVPEGLVTIDEIPHFAGLIYIKECGRAMDIKSPKLLHKSKPKNEFKYRMARKACYKYWHLAREAKDYKEALDQSA